MNTALPKEFRNRALRALPSFLLGCLALTVGGMPGGLILLAALLLRLLLEPAPNSKSLHLPNFESALQARGRRRHKKVYVIDSRLLAAS